MTGRVIICNACQQPARVFDGIDRTFEPSPMRACRTVELDGIDPKRLLVWVDHADTCVGTGTGTAEAAYPEVVDAPPDQDGELD